MNQIRTWEPGPTVRNHIHGGTVECPVRGKVDFDLCLDCPFVQEVELDTKPAHIRCCPPADLSESERTAIERLTVLQLAERMGNVSAACRIRRVSRRKFYEYKMRYESRGFAGLLDKPKPNQSFRFGSKGL